MFFKLLNEKGEYQKIDTKERVNLLTGIEIYTPDGQVSSDNLQGWNWFETFEQALEFYNIENYIEIQQQ